MLELKGMSSHQMVLQTRRVCCRYSFLLLGLRFELLSSCAQSAKLRMSLYLLCKFAKSLSICSRAFPLNMFRNCHFQCMKFNINRHTSTATGLVLSTPLGRHCWHQHLSGYVGVAIFFPYRAGEYHDESNEYENDFMNDLHSTPKI